MFQSQLQLNLGLDQNITLPPENKINRYIVAFSGGKDSLSALLFLLNTVPKHKIEIWHHLVDGREETFMDWECTEGYVRAIAQALDLPIYFSWLEGGFKGELMRFNSPKAKTYFETPEGVSCSGGNGKPNTRFKFPAKSANLKTRWCSSSLKIDVARIAIANQARFKNSTIVFVTGERRHESAARSKYAKIQYYMQPTKTRTVYQFRPVLDYSESDVWKAIEGARIRPHPAYYLGWGRLSCRSCIFGSPNQWATLKRDFPQSFEQIANLERELNHTIDQKSSISKLANQGTPYPHNQKEIKLAKAKTWTEPILTEKWELPIGAFGENNGPR